MAELTKSQHDLLNQLIGLKSKIETLKKKQLAPLQEGYDALRDMLKPEMDGLAVTRIEHEHGTVLIKKRTSKRESWMKKK